MSFFEWSEKDYPQEYEVRELIFPHLDKFPILFRRAWEEWMTIPAVTRSRISSMGRGLVIYEIVGDLLASVFGNEEDPVKNDVEICKFSFPKIYIAEKFVLRFKKVSSVHRVMLGLSSPNTKRYYEHKPMDEVRHGYGRLTAGYVLSQDQTDIEDVVITHQVDDVLRFSYSALDEQPNYKLQKKVDPPEEADVIPHDTDKEDRNIG